MLLLRFPLLYTLIIEIIVQENQSIQIGIKTRISNQETSAIILTFQIYEYNSLKLKFLRFCNSKHNNLFQQFETELMAVSSASV